MEWQALWLSLRLSFWTTLILLAIGLPAAHWLTFSPRRWKFLVEAVVALPLVLPPTVLGLYILLAIGPHSPVGRLYAALTGGMLPFSFQGLLVASVLYSLPFAVQPFASGFAAVDRKLIEASWCLGVSRAATFFRVIVPLSVPSIVTGMILSFAHTLGEFGVVLMVGGNLAGITRTVSISIYDDVQALNYGAALHTSLLLLGISFLVLAATYGLRRRVWAVWPPYGQGPERRGPQAARWRTGDRGCAASAVGHAFGDGPVRTIRSGEDHRAPFDRRTGHPRRGVDPLRR